MARYKISLLLALVIAFTSASTALVFDISVDEKVKHDFKDFNYQQEVRNLQNMNVSVMNTGSIGCEFQLRASFNDSRNSIIRYSKPHSLWPGQTARLVVHYAPDELGERKANLSLETCRGWQEKRTVNFTVQNTSSTNRTIEFNKLEVSENLIKINTNVKNALAIPNDSPSFWEVSHAQIKKGKANLSYEPEIYSPEENISYKLINKSTGESIGSFELSVNDEKDFTDYLSLEWVLVVLLISLILNLGLFYLYNSEN